MTNAHVAVIHHSGHDPAAKRGRGAIDLDGAVDASFYVEKRGDGSYSLICDGANDGPEGAVTRFTLESVEVGTDEDGEPVTAPVVAPAEGGPAETLLRSMAAQPAKALEALHGTLAVHGVVPEGARFPKGINVVTEEQWRECFYTQAGGAVSPNTLKQRFRRAREELYTAGAVQRAGVWVWPANGTYCMAALSCNFPCHSHSRK